MRNIIRPWRRRLRVLLREPGRGGAEYLGVVLQVDQVLVSSGDAPDAGLVGGVVYKALVKLGSVW